MFQIKRRHFLQLAGSGLITAGLSQLDIQRRSLQFAKSMAQGTSRKLALIVGINGYDSPFISSLNGCVTDAHLVKELLVYRFGFNPRDILLVTDDSEIKPTRAGILQAFQEHLIAQAKPGDVALFHFSGHGSQVSGKPACDSIAAGLDQCVVSTLCPSNSFQPKTTSEGGVVNDISGHTLFLLMSKVATENMTVVLDSCHSGGGTRGNFLVRSISRLGGGEVFEVSKAERELQRQLLKDLNLSNDDFIERRRAGVAKGTVIASARREQFAYDVPFDGFSAGAFTYTMSRYLWQQGQAKSMLQGQKAQPLSFGTALNGVALKSRAQSSTYGTQDLVVEYAQSANEQAPFFFSELDTPAAEAVVIEGNAGSRVLFWLGGVSAQLMESYTNETIFIAVDRQGQQIGRLKQVAREGLTGYGDVIEGDKAAFTPGTFLREEILGIPTDVTLKVALDESLKDEKDEALAALQSVSRIEVVEMGQSAQYILGRLQQDGLDQMKAIKIDPLPTLGSLGLFSTGYVPVMDSFSLSVETATNGVKRLRQKFKSLLASQMLELIGGNGGSKLKLQANIMDLARGQGDLIGTRGAIESGLIRTSPSIKQLKIDTEVRVEITNHESKDLYISALVIDTDGNLGILYPVDWEAPESASLVAANQSLTIPRTGDEPFKAHGPAGAFEFMILASHQPLRNALRGMQQIARSRGVTRGTPLGLVEGESESVVASLLGDINQQTRAGMLNQTKSHGQVDSDEIAIFSTVMEVTN